MRSTGKTAALTAINGKNSGVNCTELQKIAALTTFTGKKAVLTAFNRKISGVNDVKPEK